VVPTGLGKKGETLSKKIKAKRGWRQGSSGRVLVLSSNPSTSRRKKGRRGKEDKEVRGTYWAFVV
jgi:hypothetical protein